MKERKCISLSVYMCIALERFIDTVWSKEGWESTHLSSGLDSGNEMRVKRREEKNEISNIKKLLCTIRLRRMIGLGQQQLTSPYSVIIVDLAKSPMGQWDCEMTMESQSFRGWGHTYDDNLKPDESKVAMSVRSKLSLAINHKSALKQQLISWWMKLKRRVVSPSMMTMMSPSANIVMGQTINQGVGGRFE